MTKDELVCTAALSRLNSELGRYIVRLIDEASGSGRTQYTVPLREIEHDLGGQLAALGQALQHQARARGLVVIDSADITAQPEATRPEQGRKGYHTS